MTDSESELSNSNVFTFQNVNTTVSARGPYTNLSNFSFRNQLTSTMYNMPRNFERQRYAESISDQRSIYYRRERSPMSIQSAYDVRPRNFQRYNGISSQQSVYNGRSGSPVSMRSIDSSASVSAADIAFAFKNVKFNKNDLKVIKEAYQKLMKQRNRKRIEKRRNMRMFLKGSRNRSGDDSGEQASDSSVSSDDCRSVKTSYKENISSSRMTRMDSMLKDCTESFRQNTFKNIFSVSSTNLINSTNVKGSQNFNSSTLSNNICAIPSQKERFKTGFVLPSQRFNKTVASTNIPKNVERNLKGNEKNCKQNFRCIENRNSGSGSDEEIFPGMTTRENINCDSGALHKRSLESDDNSSFPDSKRSKKSSPNIVSKSKTKNPSKIKNTTINNNVDNNNRFEFVKPTLPVRKSKSKLQEKVLAKSKQPDTEFVEPIPEASSHKVEMALPHTTPEKPDIIQSQVEQSELSQDSEVSLRPSFIKRKLFTQKLDVAEKANLSSDAISSPQNLYSAIQKEKNKARKLVPTQSCMNREVQSDNNLLDLIHKILPPDSINRSNQTSINLTKTDVNNSNKRDDDDDNWDVSSVISMCNERDVSDTFTDEEIFDGDNKNKDKHRNIKKANNHSRTRNSNSTTPKATRKLDEKKNLSQECKSDISRIQKEKGKKTDNNTISQPKTTNNSTTKDKATRSLDVNIIPAHENRLNSVGVNKTNKENGKKANSTSSQRITRNNSIIKPKATNSPAKKINQSQDKSKINDITHLPKTRNGSNIKQKPIRNIEENKSSLTECRILVNRMPETRNVLTKETIQKTNSMNTNVTKNITKHSAKTFWDTDFESDAEYLLTPQRKIVRDNQSTVKKMIEVSKPQVKHPVLRSTPSRNEKQIVGATKCLNNTKNSIVMNNTIDSTRRFNISSLSLRSHRTSKKKRTCNCTEIRNK